MNNCVKIMLNERVQEFPRTCDRPQNMYISMHNLPAFPTHPSRHIIYLNLSHEINTNHRKPSKLPCAHTSHRIMQIGSDAECLLSQGKCVYGLKPRSRQPLKCVWQHENERRRDHLIKSNRRPVVVETTDRFVFAVAVSLLNASQFENRCTMFILACRQFVIHMTASKTLTSDPSNPARQVAKTHTEMSIR